MNVTLKKQGNRFRDKLRRVLVEISQNNFIFDSETSKTESKNTEHILDMIFSSENPKKHILNIIDRIDFMDVMYSPFKTNFFKTKRGFKKTIRKTYDDRSSSIKKRKETLLAEQEIQKSEFEEKTRILFSSCMRANRNLKTLLLKKADSFIFPLYFKVSDAFSLKTKVFLMEQYANLFELFDEYDFSNRIWREIRNIEEKYEQFLHYIALGLTYRAPANMPDLETILREYGTSIELFDSFENNMFMKHIGRASVEELKLLRETSFFDVNHRNKDGENLLTYFMKKHVSDPLEKTEYLCSIADPSDFNAKEQNALMALCSEDGRCDYESIKFMAEKEEDSIYSFNRKGMNAFLYFLDNEYAAKKRDSINRLLVNEKVLSLMSENPNTRNLMKQNWKIWLTSYLYGTSYQEVDENVVKKFLSFDEGPEPDVKIAIAFNDDIEQKTSEIKDLRRRRNEEYELKNLEKEKNKRENALALYMKFAEKHDYEAIVSLYEKGYSLYSQEYSSGSALIEHVQSAVPSVKIIDFLLKTKKIKENLGEILRLYFYNHSEYDIAIVEYLLNNGADPLLCDSNGNSCFTTLAVSFENEENCLSVMNKMFEYTDGKIKNEKNSGSPLTAYIRRMHVEFSSKFADTLVSKGACLRNDLPSKSVMLYLMNGSVPDSRKKSLSWIFHDPEPEKVLWISEQILKECEREAIKLEENFNVCVVPITWKYFAFIVQSVILYDSKESFRNAFIEVFKRFASFVIDDSSEKWKKRMSEYLIEILSVYDFIYESEAMREYVASEVMRSSFEDNKDEEVYL